MKSKVGIIGHFAFNKEFYDGQTVKTRILFDELKEKLGSAEVRCLDTYKWKSNIIKVLADSIRLSSSCDNIIINASKNGRYVFIPLCYVLKKIFGTKVYCMVIGGAFAEQMKLNRFVSFFARRLDGIYVETNIMLEDLHGLNFDNVYQLNNFKRLDMQCEEDVKNGSGKPLKLCTFSRVIREKGIEVAIDAVIRLNEQEGKAVYSLDIYGQIDEEYRQAFDGLLKDCPGYISYKGVVDYSKSVEVIKDYFMLVFPTLYKTEGIPGTIIDAYTSGVPVLASDWNSWSDVVVDGYTGMIFKMGDADSLMTKLSEVYKNPDKIVNMKKNCLEKAKEYSADIVIDKLLRLMEKESV